MLGFTFPPAASMHSRHMDVASSAMMFDGVGNAGMS